MSTASWMHGNLEVQGYRKGAIEGTLRFGLRLSTGICLVFVVTALALKSAALTFALVPIGIIAGWTPRHPFDVVWNHGVRHLVNGPPLPPNPTRRRHAFKVGTFWFAGVGMLFVAGQPLAALVLGGGLVVACAVVTLTNFCIPSALFALIGLGKSETAPQP
jgi:hypothetical protein